MPKTRPPYSPEFRRQMVDLVRAGRDPVDLAREFEPTSQSICHWVTQADRQEGRREAKGDAAERDELARLRHENSSCGWSATVSLERLPGSHKRPARSRRPQTRRGLRLAQRQPAKVGLNSFSAAAS